ncbi:FAD-dependent oxidoreductase [Kitasatospora sp. NBC_01300]|uniref:FAD-dependent oxidoreductase n=1 Tax=Kitasatospora sp. NBC_01300 TaxID=2903574 RepID=UPI00352F6E07
MNTGMTAALDAPDVLVIGAGPAGLVAAERLSAAGARVLVADTGRPYDQRTCPVDLQRTCRGCRGICNVISGFGGSIHYGDGVKLSRFPSGRRLAEQLGADAEPLTEQALDLLCGPTPPAFRRAAANTLPFTVKDYPVASLTSDQVRAVIERLHHRLAGRDGVDLRMLTRVTDLTPADDGTWTARLTSREGTRTVTARSVVAAVGRRGQAWWHRQVTTLDLDHRPPAPSVGVRFECPTHLLTGGAAVHDDFKTTLTRSGVKVKTFCFCAGPGGGRIKFTDYADAGHTLLDGHVIAEAGHHSGASNFALLAQLRAPDGQPRDTAWIDQHLLTPYRSLRTDRPGKPVIQWYPDFRDRLLRYRDLTQLTERTGLRPSLTDYQVTRLDSVLPDDVHAALTEAFEDLMAAFLPGGLTQDALRQVTVAGLELENLWDEMQLSPGMETSRPGLYAAGDCGGLAQGILQAAVAGLAAAEHHLATRATSSVSA